MRDLLSARHARRDEHLISRHRARGRQQLALADRPRHVVVLAAVAERTRHAAAPASRSTTRQDGNAREQRARRRHQAHRLLMTVPVQQHGRRSRLQRQRQPPAAPLTARDAPRTARTRLPTIRARRCASPRSSAGASSRTADRQLGSRNTMGSPRAASSYRRVDVPARRARAPRRAAPARSAAGRSRRAAPDARSAPAAVEHVRGGHPDLGMAEVGEGVVEQRRAGD